jgi:hypothetical protein
MEFVNTIHADYALIIRVSLLTCTCLLAGFQRSKKYLDGDEFGSSHTVYFTVMC